MKWPLKLLLSVIFALLFFMAWAAQEDYRAGMEQPHALAMMFSHKAHAREQCVACHHNYVDDTGGGLCIECHRTDPRVEHLMRDQFHSLCMDCHLEKREQGKKAGPLRSCIDCHAIDDDA